MSELHLYFDDKKEIITRTAHENIMVCDGSIKVSESNDKHSFYRGILDEKAHKIHDLDKGAIVPLCRTHIDTKIYDTKGGEIRLRSNIRDSITQYINSYMEGKKTNIATTSFDPYAAIKITNELCIYLGNAVFVDELVKIDDFNESKMSLVLKNIRATVATNFLGSVDEKGSPVKHTINEQYDITNIGLIVSANGGEYYNNIPFKHMHLQMYEDDTREDFIKRYKITKPKFEPAIFYDLLQYHIDLIKKVFCDMDDALNEGKNIFIHCNAGEHRSASLLITYLCSRSGIIFDNVWSFINHHREIKPYIEDGKRNTYMKALYKKINLFNPQPISHGGSYSYNKKMYNNLQKYTNL